MSLGSIGYEICYNTSANEKIGVLCMFVLLGAIGIVAKLVER